MRAVLVCVRLVVCVVVGSLVAVVAVCAVVAANVAAGGIEVVLLVACRLPLRDPRQERSRKGSGAVVVWQLLAYPCLCQNGLGGVGRGLCQVVARGLCPSRVVGRSLSVGTRVESLCRR